MRILYFIGNGFDINLGMKTRYSDFYKYYQTIETENDVVKKLKKNISGDYKNWSDLEFALGKYTNKIESIDEFDQVYEDVEDNLADYLKLQESKFDFSQTDEEILLNDLIYPESHLPPADKIKINESRNKTSSSHVINLVTFNYTKSIESILKENYTNITLGDKSGNKIKFTGVEHIHGYIDDRMVMGVNDITQIAKTEFHSNQDVLETLVKSDCNKILKHNIDDRCKKLIASANLICIFGCSIGDTDKLWWELIGNQLKRQSLLIIFEKGEDIIPRRRHLSGRKERKIKEMFLSKTNLNEDEKVNLIDNIFVGINSNIFDLIKKQSPVANNV